MNTQKKTAKKAVKKKAVKKFTRGKKTPTKQASKIDGCGNGGIKPPKEYQFKPGQSGNPSGPPIRRTQLWVWFCKFMDMTDKELGKLRREKLTQAQQTALKLVENAKDGKYSGSERLARYVIDRDEGKAIEHLVIENENTLTDDECAEIREVLARNANG